MTNCNLSASQEKPLNHNYTQITSKLQASNLSLKHTNSMLWVITMYTTNKIGYCTGIFINFICLCTMVLTTDIRKRRYMSWMASQGLSRMQNNENSFNSFVTDFLTFGPSDAICDTRRLVLISVVLTHNMLFVCFWFNWVWAAQKTSKEWASPCIL